jgi:NADH-quinone oxidoreductase subunit G
VPVVGQDEVFPKGFTIRAERCPNRRGVEEIIKHFQQNVTTWDQLLPQLDSGKIQAVYVTANYPDAWIDDAEAARFDKVPLKIVQDILASPLARRAQWVVPGVTFAEKAGSYVNHAGLIQMTDWGIRPHEGAHVDGQTFSDLLGRRGLYQAADVTRELAAQIPFFARAKDGIPESGLNLVTGQEKHPATTQLGTVTHPLPTFRSVASPMLEVEGLRHTQVSIAHIPEGDEVAAKPN